MGLAANCSGPLWLCWSAPQIWGVWPHVNTRWRRGLRASGGPAWRSRSPPGFCSPSDRRRPGLGEEGQPHSDGVCTLPPTAAASQGGGDLPQSSPLLQETHPDSLPLLPEDRFVPIFKTCMFHIPPPRAPSSSGALGGPSPTECKSRNLFPSFPFKASLIPGNVGGVQNQWKD